MHRLVTPIFSAVMMLSIFAWGPGQAQGFTYPPNDVPPGAMGFNPKVNYTLPNYSQSPNIRKFVDKLPGLGAAGCTLGSPGAVPPYSDGTCGQNDLGQYIPVAQPDTTSYPGSDYYEIAVKNYSVRMHLDLPATGTALRGYVQTNATDPAIQNVNQYLGPAIIARVWNPNLTAGVGGNGKPVRIKFTNMLPLSSTTPATTDCSANPLTTGRLCLPTSPDIMGAGQGPLGPAPYGTTTCDMGVQKNCDVYTENRVTIPHLHGGRTPWISDGTPHQWITPAGDPIPGTATAQNPYGMKKGPSFENVPDMVNGSVINGTAVPCIGQNGKCYTPSANDGQGTLFYTNEQSARLMFWHDHTFGLTRLTVYKGIAAPYLLVDNVDDDLIDNTNTSGFNTWNNNILPSQSWGGAVYKYGIPLVIQDKAFVNDTSTNNPALLTARNFPAAEYAPTDHTYEPTCTGSTYLTATDSTVCGTDPLWQTYVGTTGGQLHMPHEYMPVENIYDPTGNTTNGRWDYGPFLIPPAIPTNLTLPTPTIVPEHFADTMVVNGTAYPYIELPPDIVRFRILSVGNDRSLNLSLFKADPLRIQLTNRGSGYATAPGVIVSAPPCTINGTTCVQATATAMVSTGVITNITPVSNCRGFSSPPTVTLTGGGGTCSQPISASIAWNSEGIISGFQGLIDPVTGAYTCTGFSSGTPPTITISDGGGRSCTATATIIDSGQIASITVTNPGAGYTSTTPGGVYTAPTVTIAAPSPGPGTTATAVAFLATEVKLVDAAPNPAYPTWPVDGRWGGVPDPTTQGPPWILVGNEGGLLAQASVIPPQPIDYEYDRRNLPFAGVTSHSLYLLPAQRADVLVDLRAYNPGDTLIVYNDAPAPNPAWWPINDYSTDYPDMRPVGGAPTPAPGFGPNTRTIMQIRIVSMSFTPFQPGLNAQQYQAMVQTAIPKAFAVANDPPIVPQIAYNDAFPSGPHHATADTFAQALDSTLNLTGAPQGIARILTTAPGNNYTVAPLVNIISSDGNGSGAVATAGLNPNGGLTLLTAGSGYTSVPTCTISAPTACTAATGCVRATCVATVSGGIVNAITISEPGAGYSTTTAATCTLTGGGGTGATCSTFVAAANTVGSITVTLPGSGYTSEPRVYLTPKNNSGLGASAVALLSGLGGTGGSPLTYGVMTGKNITEGFDPEYGRLDIRMGSTPNPLTPTVGAGMVLGLARYVDPPTEILNDGETTLWRITHLGMDSHALHFHLFDVQVINRIDPTNVIKPPYWDELGWRDTIRTNPLEDIVVAFRPHTVYLPFPMPQSNRLLDPTTPVNSVTNFYPIAPPAGVAAVPQVTNIMTNFSWEYVFHCHMLEHEENDFMRPMVLTGTPPPVPAGLAATVTYPTSTTAQVVLTWTGSFPSATGFTIQRSTSSTFPAASTTTFPIGGTPPPNMLTDASASQNVVYYYRVQSSNIWGSSAWSAPLTVVTAATPANFNCVATAGTPTDSVTCTWTDGSNPTNFTVQRLDFNGGLINYSVAGTLRSFTQAVTKANTYWYRIRANITGGSSPYSPTVTVVAP